MREAQAFKFNQRSINDPDGFWNEQTRLIDWHTPPARVLDPPAPPFREGFVGGETSLRHNAPEGIRKAAPYLEATP